ncbi:MAG: 5-oxoprolinase subunit PxpB [Anaerolineae bacterium]|nr:5-oxoprolinase subunit PxpB [Anaerolineae bacterium]
MPDHTRSYPRVIPVGETALTVEFGEVVDPRLNRMVHALDAQLQAYPQQGILETVPTYRSLLVMFDPCAVSVPSLSAFLLEISEDITDKADNQDMISGSGQLFEVPVHYGGEYGPDLPAVATHTQLSPEAVIQTHTTPIYQVAMLGFAPGFTYLIGLPPSLHTPRLATPRMHIPPGSIGIAGTQTGLYALDTPGGWQIIGRTSLMLFDPQNTRPFRLQAGDYVRFIAI